ncbi:hypothetical protein K3N28_19160 [Glycomyces sp. TRM65418]|uniref:hypothetical protein n=1 Tax=Glycomyces sp. TRM65418 TaxID=2867006 RepID=UPI001CE4F34E|nr:hypothetical protein [Glycomyces sp. TRM65418]MCC3765181.1 hypothetical protein [Glycomyces sp. TRM65418]QZD54806.1 hypothetical protein K3N28_19065 [Glycomyces sp. TRM65418]
MAERVIDPEALEEYRAVVREQLDHLDSIITRLENGQPLGRLPAFGQLDASVTARQNYTTFHETTWTNLQNLRESLHGMINTLNDSAELAEEADTDAQAEMLDYESQL